MPTSASTRAPEKTSTTSPFLKTRSAGTLPRAMSNRLLMALTRVFGSDGPKFAPGQAEAAAEAAFLINLGVSIDADGAIDTAPGTGAAGGAGPGVDDRQ